METGDEGEAGDDMTQVSEPGIGPVGCPGLRSYGGYVRSWVCRLS